MSSVRERRRWTPDKVTLTWSGSVTSIFLSQREQEAVRQEEEERRNRDPLGFGPQRPRRRVDPPTRV